MNNSLQVFSIFDMNGDRELQRLEFEVRLHLLCAAGLEKLKDDARELSNTFFGRYGDRSGDIDMSD